MRQANICYPFIINPYGGSFVSTKLLAKNLSEEYTYQFVFATNGSAASKAQQEGLRTKILNLRPDISARLTDETSLFDEVLIGAALLPYMLRIRRFLQSESIDLVHVNDGLTAMIWGLPAKTLDVTIVWHVRAEGTNPWDRLRLRLCDHVVFVAKSNKQRFSDKQLDAVSTSVIHNGVNLSSFSASDSDYLSSELGLSEEGQIVGFVGNLVDRKRPMLFVESALAILEETEGIHFVIVGEDIDGYGDAIWELGQEHGVSDNIHLLGYRDDVADIMPSLDLLVLTSTEHGEAFPRVPLEAMASGTPVVTTDTAGVSEAVVDGETGIVLSTDPTPSDIASQILGLLRDKSRLANFSTNAVSHTRANFSNEQYVEDVRRIYERIL